MFQYPAIKDWSSLITYFNKDIHVDDGRSKMLPTEYTGTIVGLTLDKVQVRRNNNLTEWLPLNHSKINFYPVK